MFIVAGTGHRPNKLGGYGHGIAQRLEEFAYQELRSLRYERGPFRVISGMAQGWDQALARAAIRLSFPFDAYIPFVGQEAMWPDAAQEEYFSILYRASRQVVCSPGGYATAKMQIRNERMVDDCNLLLSLWDGTDGGTANCMRYAERIDREKKNLWPQWAAIATA